MTLTIVVAAASNGVIGRGGELPWHLPSDLKRFKELTIGHAVIMGRRTYESLPAKVRPLPGRLNVVVSASGNVGGDGAVVASSLEEAVSVAGNDAFVIGGAQIYQQALPLADAVELTLVEDAIDGDVRFPLGAIGSEWDCTFRGALQFDGDAGLHFRFLTYQRRTT